MEDLLITLVKGLVEHEDAVSVTVEEPHTENNNTSSKVYHLHVAKEDMGKVIGKQGRIAKAIRVLMRAASSKYEEKVVVEID